MAQTVGIIAVFVPGHDLINALPQQRQRIMTNAVVLSRIAEELGQIAGQTMVLIKGSQGQKTGIAGDLAAREISADELMTVEGEAQLWYNTLHQAMDAPKGMLGPRNPVFMPLLEHPFFFGQQNQ